MLWSLTKIVLFVCIIAGLALGAGYLMEAQGGIQVSVGTVEFNLGPLQSVIAAVVLIAVIWVVLRLLGLLVAVFRFISGDETAITRWLHRNRERQGFEALADSMMALASGEGRVALNKAAKAEKYLNRPELTNLVTAQAAELAEDRAKAEETYKLLLADERTRFVGIRGIMKQKLADGDNETALKLAERAFALRPKHVEMQDTLLQLQSESGDWSGARKTLAAKLKHGALPRDVHKRRDAVLALSEARDLLDDSTSIETREAAIAANKMSPDLIPAATMAARGYIEQGKLRLATRLLRKAWETRPHPDLAAAFAEIVPDETPAARLKRFETLTRLRPEDTETKLLLAELNISAEDFPAARRAMGDLADADPTQRTLTIMAAIERGQGADDAVVRGYLARAVGAPRGPQWVCGNCNSVYAEWAPVCENCGAFDTLDWKRPPHDSAARGQGADMLPLIVGAPEPEEAETVVEDLVDLETPVEAVVVEEDAAEDAEAKTA